MHFRRLLILGGARSGKSRFAQQLAEKAAGNKIYLATAEAGDAEMAERIKAHRRERGAGWETVEAPLRLAESLGQQADTDIVVVDCLTLWLSNVMLAGQDVDAAIAGLAEAIRKVNYPLVLVSNEVGLGIVPENLLGRRFRDWQGILNRVMAETCDGVVFMAAGCPLLLKPSSLPEIHLG